MNINHTGRSANTSLTTVWIVSELYYPEQTSTGYFLTKIAESLADEYDVRVICGQPGYSERGLRAPARERRNGVLINRLRSTNFSKDQLPLRILNVLTFTFAVFWHLLTRLRSNHRLLVVTNPPGAPITASLANMVRRAPSILLVHDVYPEILSVTGILKERSWLWRVLARLMRLTFRSYDQVIVLGRDMQKLVLDKTDLPVSRVPIIPNWGDIEEIKPVARNANEFAHVLGLQEQTIIQFSGNIGRTHDVESILEVARELKCREDIIFLFVGYGGKAHLLKDAVANEGLKNIRFEQRQPRERLAQMLACSDATIIAFSADMKGLSVPSRMYNIFAAGVPIIAMADADSELSLMVADNEAGWVIDPGDRACLKDTIISIADGKRGNAVKSNATILSTMSAPMRGQRGRAALVPDYTLEQVGRRYAALIKAL